MDTAIVSHDARARITARAKATAVDDHLVGVTNDVLFARSAANLVLHVYAGIDAAIIYTDDTLTKDSSGNAFPRVVLAQQK